VVSVDAVDVELEVEVELVEVELIGHGGHGPPQSTHLSPLQVSHGLLQSTPSQHSSPLFPQKGIHTPPMHLRKSPSAVLWHRDSLIGSFISQAGLPRHNCRARICRCSNCIRSRIWVLGSSIAGPASCILFSCRSLVHICDLHRIYSMNSMAGCLSRIQHRCCFHRRIQPGRPRRSMVHPVPRRPRNRFHQTGSSDLDCIYPPGSSAAPVHRNSCIARLHSTVGFPCMCCQSSRVPYASCRSTRECCFGRLNQWLSIGCWGSILHLCARMASHTGCRFRILLLCCSLNPGSIARLVYRIVFHQRRCLLRMCILHPSIFFVLFGLFSMLFYYEKYFVFVCCFVV